MLPSSSGHGDVSFCTLILWSFWIIYMFTWLCSSQIPSPTPKFVFEKKKYLSVILERIYCILSHVGGCGVLFENCIFMRVSMFWLGNIFLNFVFYSLDFIIIYNLDAPTPRKSLVLRREHFLRAVKAGHFDKSHCIWWARSLISASHWQAPVLEISGSNSPPCPKLANVM